MPCAAKSSFKIVLHFNKYIDSHICFDKNWFSRGDHFILNMNSGMIKKISGGPMMSLAVKLSDVDTNRKDYQTIHGEIAYFCRLSWIIPTT